MHGRARLNGNELVCLFVKHGNSDGGGAVYDEGVVIINKYVLKGVRPAFIFARIKIAAKRRCESVAPANKVQCDLYMYIYIFECVCVWCGEFTFREGGYI